MNEKNKGHVLKIGKPYITVNGDLTRITAEVTVDGLVKLVWFEVCGEYGKYLCNERSDAYLIGFLWIAMRNGYDIVCEAPVTGELLYQVETYLIPALVKSSKVMRAPHITCEVAEDPIANIGAVGTGISCGIDSLHVVRNHARHPLKNLRLTHLAIYNVGAFGCFDLNKADRQFRWQIENSRRLCDELGLKLIVANSNLKQEFFTDNRFTHTYSNMFAVYMLQKLWGTYYYASSGLVMSFFDVAEAEHLDSSHYDLLSLACYSTRVLRVYSEGASKSRCEKTKDIIDFPQTRKYLHVCCYDEGKNCGKCFKCKRTLVTLDALGVIDKFGEVFDIDYYKKHRNEYLTWLSEQRYGHTEENDLICEVFNMFSGGIPCKCRLIAFARVFGRMTKAWLKRHRIVLWVYRALKRLGGFR